MPLRRWVVLLVLLCLSFVVSVVPVVYVLLTNPAQYGRPFPSSPRLPGGVPLLQLAEPLLDYGLLRLREWAKVLGVVYFASKGVFAVGLSVGLSMGGRREALWVGLPLGALWLGIVAFLYVNRVYFNA